MLNRKLVMALLSVILIVLAGVFPLTAADSQKININTATSEELEKLNGIGPKYAAAIIEYREKWGAFKTPEDIMQVQGIGQKTFEKNQDLLRLSSYPI